MSNIFSGYARNVIDQLPPGRLLALDVFRGITIAAMILVNNPGSWSYVYAPMAHAKWHGWTPTDLIFPFFIFIAGVSVAIVMNRELAKGTDKLFLLKHAFVRAVKLFALGLFLALFYYNFSDPDFSWVDAKLFSMRVMGVLQRIGLVYFATVFIVLYWQNLGRWLWAIGLLLGYWALVMLTPYSDSAGNTYIGLLEFGNSLPAFIDNYVFSAKHLYYASATPFAFDPEGLISTLPAISGCLAGVFTGNILTNKALTLAGKAKKMLVIGLVCAIVGELWGLVFPINKALWTSSFVVMSSGWALLTLAALTWLIDIKGKKYWSAPFVVCGANAIFFYMFAGVLARLLMMIPVADSSLGDWLFSDVLQPLFGNYNGSLMFAISFLFVSYWVLDYLYRKKIFFKV
ncbi:DUF5009 domain-containing protein [Thalassotalea litorea]|uniref:DUF5009 domain-containing protein n=1 Tax=Thalassotalea litorea TaxID=2020715 RepID=A0A5R9IPA1_9GAMM|nr:DUF5009 domain-containing protein [Thalassotalea litorea]TLU67374.1 DUF5009 domain-containing protein [Thalassotalea litorea]